MGRAAAAAAELLLCFVRRNFMHEEAPELGLHAQLSQPAWSAQLRGPEDSTMLRD